VLLSEARPAREIKSVSHAERKTLAAPRGNLPPKETPRTLDHSIRVYVAVTPTTTGPPLDPSSAKLSGLCESRLSAIQMHGASDIPFNGHLIPAQSYTLPLSPATREEKGDCPPPVKRACVPPPSVFPLRCASNNFIRDPPFTLSTPRNYPSASSSLAFRCPNAYASPRGV